jgi:hypothetical protein
MLVELSVVEQRYQAVLAVIRDGVPVGEVASRFGVLRQAVTGDCGGMKTRGGAIVSRISRTSTAPRTDVTIGDRRPPTAREHPTWAYGDEFETSAGGTTPHGPMPSASWRSTIQAMRIDRTAPAVPAASDAGHRHNAALHARLAGRRVKDPSIAELQTLARSRLDEPTAELPRRRGRP